MVLILEEEVNKLVILATYSLKLLTFFSYKDNFYLFTNPYTSTTAAFILLKISKALDFSKILGKFLNARKL